MRNNTYSRRQFKQDFAKLLENTFIPTNLSNQEVVRRYSDLFSYVEPHIPSRLYRFRQCSIDSILDFEHGRISVCTANRFSDRYDSHIFYNYKTLDERMQIASHQILPQFLQAIKTNPSSFPSNPITIRVLQMIDAKDSDNAILDFLNTEIGKKATEWVAQVKLQEQWPRDYSTTRIACFTETVKSKFMWDTYAGGYTGFSLEYDFRNWRTLSIDNIPVCLFPVIYSSKKMDATEMIDRLSGQEYMRSWGVDESALQAYTTAFPVDYLYWLKMFLYKDKVEYSHEKEWRILELPPFVPGEKRKEFSSIQDAGTLKAIYYGPEMEDRYKAHLREVARKKGILEFDVTLNRNSRKYELGVSRLK